MNFIDVRNKYVNLVNSQDAKGISALFSKQAIRKSPGEPDSIGSEEIFENYQTWFATFSNASFSDKYQFKKDNVVVSIWSWNAIHTGEFMGVPATNKKIGLEGASIFWFNNSGQIIREHTYADPYTLMIQLGVIQDTGRPVPDIPSNPNVVNESSVDSEAKNLLLLRKYNQLLVNKELEDWLDCMTDDIEWDDQMVPGLAIGKDHSKADFEMLSVAFPDAKINMNNMWAVGPYVIHQSIFTATHVGPIKGIPASNKVVNVDNMDIVFFEGGKISKGWTFGNTLDMGAQMGLGQ